MPIPAVAKLLVDRDCLAVAGALAARPSTIDELVLTTGCDRRTVLEAVGALRACGIVTAGERYELDAKALRIAAEELADADVPMDPVIGFGMTDDERQVLKRFFSGRVLDEIPMNRAKRLIVLERLALEFDLGRRYAEPEVNEILAAFNPDVSSLRRHMIDEGMLDREHVDGVNTYWRSGGRVTGSPSS
ncbi:MAG TPA: DUF2087 domain-containing protein [Ilumatobacter sp.]|nr:DUF2087 domain-containing protein [Ilumatobacter sp.]